MREDTIRPEQEATLLGGLVPFHGRFTWCSSVDSSVATPNANAGRMAARSGRLYPRGARFAAVCNVGSSMPGLAL